MHLAKLPLSTQVLVADGGRTSLGKIGLQVEDPAQKRCHEGIHPGQGTGTPVRDDDVKPWGATLTAADQKGFRSDGGGQGSQGDGGNRLRVGGGQRRNFLHQGADELRRGGFCCRAEQVGEVGHGFR